MAPLAGLSSMATRALLAELATAWPGQARMEWTGGVDAARRVRAGEALDIVVLADAVMRRLAAEGFVIPDSLTGLAISSIAVAVRQDAPLPELANAAALQRTLQNAGRVGYSTGPSGDHIVRLVDSWGLRDTITLVQAPPAIPVGQLLAENAVDLALQQRSELLGLPGIVIAGELPAEAACDTQFTAGVLASSAQPAEAARFIAYLATPDTAAVKQRHGMRQP